MNIALYGDRKNGYSAHGEYENGVDTVLLPCPFCNGTEINVMNTHTPYYWAECQECGAEVSGDFEASFSGSRIRTMKACRWAHEKSFQSAIKVWNTRLDAGSRLIGREAILTFIRQFDFNLNHPEFCIRTIGERYAAKLMDGGK